MVVEGVYVGVDCVGRVGGWVGIVFVVLVVVDYVDFLI